MLNGLASMCVLSCSFNAIREHGSGFESNMNYFYTAGKNYLSKATLGQKFLLILSVKVMSIIVGMAQEQKHVSAVHVASIIKKQRGVNASAHLTWTILFSPGSHPME